MSGRLLLVVLAAACVAFPFMEAAKGEWIEGRATFFDAPDYWKARFEKGRFGDLYGSSCGYVNRKAGVTPSNADMPFPIGAVGAVADFNLDYPGSCGRCYEVRCKPGFIRWDNTTIISQEELLYMPGIAPDLKDPKGRPWPGVPKEADARKQLFTECWEPRESVFIRIIDSCPCNYIGGRQQRPCCGPIPHMDLSFWAFNKLAHPLYGLMMTEFRPVNCDTRQPLDYRKPFISSTIYGNGPGAGWSWRTWYEQESKLMVPGAGRGRSNATCINLTKGGGLAFACKECQRQGFQPLKGKTALQFWIRSNSPSTSENDSATPKGKAPKLSVFLSQFHELVYTKTGKMRDPEIFCQTIDLKDRTPSQVDGEWYQYTIPIADFQCSGQIPPDTVNRIAFENKNDNNALFCLDKFKLI